MGGASVLAGTNARLAATWVGRHNTSAAISPSSDLVPRTRQPRESSTTARETSPAQQEIEKWRRSGRSLAELRFVPTSAFGEDAFGRKAEAAARFFGTPKYIIGQTLIVIAWIAVNAVAISFRWDPYPFILLNLAFSTQAAYAAPLILLAQTRQADRDKAALDLLETHREEVMRHMQEREAAIKKETDELKELLTSNTDLTRQDKELTEKIELLTREIHARMPAS
jgi:uncharacterized membrane protein